MLPRLPTAHRADLPFLLNPLNGLRTAREPVCASATIAVEMERLVLSARCLFLQLILLVFGTGSLAQQQQPVASPRPASRQQSIFLVFPFENIAAGARLDWLSEGLEELTIQRLFSAGEQVYSHEGREVELERSGLPRSAKLSRATMLHVAEDLDADFVVFGKYSASGTSLTIQAQILKVSPARLSAGLQETGSLDSLMDLHSRLVWRLLSASDRHYSLSLADFTKRQRPLRLDAFEHYTRGLLANDDDLRLRELREAARLEPDWPDPDFALGEAYFARRDCDSALTWYSRVPKTHEGYAESIFSIGVCRLLQDHPDRAEDSFTSLQDALKNNMVSGADIPEILNDLAIARARQGKTPAAVADLRRAVSSDPSEGDYPFNLGLLALRSGDFNDAAEHFRDAVEREPDNAEDRSLLILSLEKAGKNTEADQERESAKETFGPNGLPAIKLDPKNESLAKLDRIKSELDVTSLRTEIESASAVSPSAASPSDPAEDHYVQLLRLGRQELSAGRTDTAEKYFRSVLEASPTSPAAHRGLAEIDLRQGKTDDAVKELQSSLDARDSAVVRTMLAKVYLEQKKPDLARTEVEKAIKLAPNYAEAKQLLDRLQNSKSSGKKPAGGAS